MHVFHSLLSLEKYTRRIHVKGYMYSKYPQTPRTALPDFEISGSDTDHLRGPLTLTPVAERLAVELSPPVLLTRLGMVPFLMRGERSNRLRPRGGARCF